METSLTPVRFSKSETVIECEPFVKCLTLAKTTSHCYRCLSKCAPMIFVMCPDCLFARYCSEECRKLDLEEAHMLECDLWWRSSAFRYFCTKDDEASDKKLMIVRLHAMLRTKPAQMTQKWTSNFCLSQCFEDVLKRPEVQAGSPQEMADCKIMADFINDIRPYDPVELTYLLQLASVVRSKRCRIVLEDNAFDHTGWGIYIVPATIDHSCKPTAVLVGMGLKLRVRAIADIPEGKAPTVRYVFAHLNRAERQRVLKDHYNINCCCDMCVSKTDATVAYAKLNFLLHGMRALSAGFIVERCTWPDVLKLNNEIIGTFKEIYHEYDEHVTDQIFRTLAIGIKYNVPKHAGLEQIYFIACHQFMNTYGLDSAEFRAFKCKTQELFC